MCSLQRPYGSFDTSEMIKLYKILQDNMTKQQCLFDIFLYLVTCEYLLCIMNHRRYQHVYNYIQHMINQLKACV